MGKDVVDLVCYRLFQPDLKITSYLSYRQVQLNKKMLKTEIKQKLVIFVYKMCIDMCMIAQASKEILMKKLSALNFQLIL